MMKNDKDYLETNINTSKIDQIIGESDSEEDLFELLKSIDECDLDKEWKNTIVTKYKDYTGNRVSKLKKCILENYKRAQKYYSKIPAEKTISNYLSKVPPHSHRNDIILICALCGMSCEEVNKCLQRLSRTNSLYAKDTDDSIWIYIINNKNKYIPQDYLLVFNSEKEKITKCINQYKVKGCTRKSLVDTLEISQMLNSNTGSYESIVNEDIVVSLLHAHDKLIELLNEAFYLDMNTRRYVKIFEFHEEGSGAYKKLNNAKQVLFSGVIPKRNELIALCLHLKLNKDGVNYVLLTAGMEPLMPKNSMEAIIQFCLEQLEIYCPNAFNRISREKNNKLDELCDEYDLKSLKFEELKLNSLWRYIKLGNNNDDGVVNISAACIRGMLIEINKQIYNDGNEDISLMIQLL